MLQLRPNCEYCDKDLPPDSEEACICTYECTFCRDCVETNLHNVCPNCGGSFEKRPIRPKIARRKGVSLEFQPASKERIHLKQDREEVSSFAEQHREIPPEKR